MRSMSVKRSTKSVPLHLRRIEINISIPYFPFIRINDISRQPRHIGKFSSTANDTNNTVMSCTFHKFICIIPLRRWVSNVDGNNRIIDIFGFGKVAHKQTDWQPNPHRQYVNALENELWDDVVTTLSISQ